MATSATVTTVVTTTGTSDPAASAVNGCITTYPCNDRFKPKPYRPSAARSTAGGQVLYSNSKRKKGNKRC